jgi:hypothetical protein
MGAKGEGEMLTDHQRAELERLGPSSVRKLIQGDAGREASISGFECGDITCGDIDDWLVEKHLEYIARQQGLVRWAQILLWTSLFLILTFAMLLYKHVAPN